MKKKISADWTKKTFVEYGDIVFDFLTAPKSIYQNTPQQVEFIHSLLKNHFPKAKRILDVPCGDGRISLGLLTKGYAVTGVDISPGYIKKANSEVKGNNKAQFLIGDMRELRFDREFDAVVNWFGSFGYFDDETNEKVLQRFINALAKNGALIIDLTNRDYIVQRMGGFYEWEPEVVLKKGKRKLFGKYGFDPFTNRIEAEIEIEGAKEKIYYTMRYYGLHELVGLLEKNRMRVLEAFGDYSGGKYSLFSPRMIIVACK
ncbi:MAG: hypothetical protein AMJ90_07530 [candidate division Zixibacteria bacterium SM23_73_2]|nr:MAG: hypothetical protein AMJ90_07530 [candidate division Zixibacteria bacterium SM23_73_2]